MVTPPPRVDLFILPIALGTKGVADPQRRGGQGPRRQQSLSIPEWHGHSVTDDSWFAQGCPGFRTESPESHDTSHVLANQAGWSLQMPLAPFPAPTGSFSAPFPFAKFLI